MNIFKKYRYVNKLIKKSSSVFIMSHKNMDLDAIGSSIAIYSIVEKLKKKVYIILNDTYHEAGVLKILNQVEGSINFVKSRDLSKLIENNSLLILADVNRPCIMQDGNIVSLFNNIIVFDHHEKTKDTVNSTIEIINCESGSTSEMILEYMHYFNYKTTGDIATYLLSGITLDTNNFTSKTTDKTHYAAYSLIRMGASVRNVNILLKQDIEDYILRQRVISDVEIINKKIAFTKGSNRVFYKREELAKIADTLLEFDDIEMSFVIGKMSDNEIGISARGNGEVNIGEFLFSLGGGGGRYDGACVIRDVSLKELEGKLKSLLEEIQ